MQNKNAELKPYSLLIWGKNVVIRSQNNERRLWFASPIEGFAENHESASLESIRLIKEALHSRFEVKYPEKIKLLVADKLIVKANHKKTERAVFHWYRERKLWEFCKKKFRDEVNIIERKSGG